MMTGGRNGGGSAEAAATGPGSAGSVVSSTPVLGPRLTLGKMQNPVRGFLHGTAATASLVGTGFLVGRAPAWPSRIALLVFGLGLAALYTTSSVYHSVPWREPWRRRMQRLDHSMIFVLIAATYTPIAVIVLDGMWRWGTLTIVWGLTVVGIGQHILYPRPEQNFSIALATSMGWVAGVAAVPLARRAGLGAVALAALGGILYTMGMVFLVTNRPRLWPRVFSYHELFHVLVVAASVVHFTMTWRYVVPLAA